MSTLDSSWKARSDVRIHRHGTDAYVYSSEQPFRIPLPTPSPEEKRGGEVPITELPADALSHLAGRGLLVPSGTRAPHVSYPARPAASTPVHIFGNDEIDIALSAALGRAGATVLAAPHPRHRAGVAVLSLGLSDHELLERSRRSIESGHPLVVHAASMSRLHLAVLRPPRTACPLCLVHRIRAMTSPSVGSSVPLGVLLGSCADARWPSTTAAVGIIAHHVLRVLEPSSAREELPGELLELQLDPWSSVRHPISRMPRCPGCATRHFPRTARTRQSSPPQPHADWARMQRVIDPLTGMVGEVRTADAEPTAYRTVAWCLDRTPEHNPAALPAAAKIDPVEAKVCAVGKALERYAVTVAPSRRLRRCGHAELGDRAVDPALLGCDPDAPPMAWIEGLAVSSMRPRYVPVRQVYPDSSATTSPLPRTGLACGSTWDQALQRGILEVVEHDAFAVFWYNQLRLPELDLDGVHHGRLRLVLERVHARGIEVQAREITTDLGIPAVVLSARTPRCTVYAVRADLQLETCVFEAAQELELRLFEQDSGEPRTKRAADLPPSSLSRQVPPAMRLVGTSPVDELIARLTARGFEPVAVNITPIDLADCGLTVLRCVVPGLQPLTRPRDEGVRRWADAPVRMGARPEPLAFDELNREPMPLV